MSTTSVSHLRSLHHFGHPLMMIFRLLVLRPSKWFFGCSGTSTLPLWAIPANLSKLPITRRTPMRQLAQRKHFQDFGRHYSTNSLRLTSKTIRTSQLHPPYMLRLTASSHRPSHRLYFLSPPLRELCATPGLFIQRASVTMHLMWSNSQFALHRNLRICLFIRSVSCTRVTGIA